MSDNNFNDILINNRILTDPFARSKAAARALAWYRDLTLKGKAGKYTLKERSRQVVDIGTMYTFHYDPKTKDKLPFYDTNPLIFAVEHYKDGFLGINLHYLPPNLRARLMDTLHSITTDQRYNENTKLNVSYSVLKAMTKARAFEPCVKRYLYSHVRSPFVKLFAPEWAIAVLLPTQKFVKRTADYVWETSMSRINKRR